MHTKNINGHLHPANEQIRSDVYQSISHKLLNRSKTCVIESEELTRLDALLQTEFPTVYDLLGGIEGLLMCLSRSGEPITYVCKTEESIHEQLSVESLSALDAVVESETEFSGNEFIYDNATKEYISWGFTETVIQAAKAYREILVECLSGIMNTPNTIHITMLTKSPITNVYFIQFKEIEF